MKIHLLSDLHIEFEPFTPSPAASEADVIVLAGDINVKARGVDWARNTFGSKAKILYVPGNHEFYSNGHIDRTLEKMRAAACDRVRVLDNEEWIINGVRFLGATCWTDYTSTDNQILAKYEAQRGLTDFKKIRAAGYRKVQTDDLVLRNQMTLTWLCDRLAEPFNRPTVVVTHHAPSLLSFGNIRVDGSESHLDASYANNWESLMGRSVSLWLHGHIHRAVDYEINGTRVICNPRGYPGESTCFNPDLLITVKEHRQEIDKRVRFNAKQLVFYSTISEKPMPQEDHKLTEGAQLGQFDEILRSYAVGNIARRDVEEATGLC